MQNNEYKYEQLLLFKAKVADQHSRKYMAQGTH